MLDKVAAGKKVAEERRRAVEDASISTTPLQDTAITTLPDILSASSASQDLPSIQAQLRAAVQDTSLFHLNKHLKQQNFAAPIAQEEVVNQEKPKPKRLSDGQVVLRTTASMAAVGAVIGGALGVAAVLGFAIPTFGLSLLATPFVIPIFAGIGAVVVGGIGLIGSSLGVGLDRLARHIDKKTDEQAQRNREEYLRTTTTAAETIMTHRLSSPPPLAPAKRSSATELTQPSLANSSFALHGRKTNLPTNSQPPAAPEPTSSRKPSK